MGLVLYGAQRNHGCRNKIVDVPKDLDPVLGHDQGDRFGEHSAAKTAIGTQNKDGGSFHRE